MIPCEHMCQGLYLPLCAPNKSSRVRFSHHGVEAVGKVPAHPSCGAVFTAQLFDLLLRLMEHLYTLSIPLGQLVELQQTRANNRAKLLTSLYIYMNLF